MNGDGDLFYNLRVVVRILGVSEKTVRSYHNAGLLAAYMVGHRLQFEENSLLDFLAAARTPKMTELEREALRREMRSIRASMGEAAA